MYSGEWMRILAALTECEILLLRSSSDPNFFRYKMAACCCPDAEGRVLHHLKEMSSQTRQSHLCQRKSQFFAILHNACQNANIELLNVLLEPFSLSEQYKLLSHQGRNGNYPLHSVLAGSDTSSADRTLIVQYILNLVPEKEKLKYLKLPRSCKGQTALQMAAELNDDKVADVLVSYLDFEQQNNLLGAVDNNKKSVLDYQLTVKFKSALKITAVSRTGPEDEPHRQPSNPTHPMKPYQNKFQRSFTAPCLSLTQKNISLTALDSVLEMASYNDEVNIKFLTDQYLDSQGKTLLHLAAEQSDVVAVKKLLRFCHPLEKRWQLISKRCRAGMTALHYACMKNNHDVIVELMYQSKQHDETLIDMKDNNQKTALQYADKAKKELFSLVRTHYWRTYFKPPTVLVFFNRYHGDPDWERSGADEECNDIIESFNQLGINPLQTSDFTRNVLIDTIKTHAMFDTMSALIVFIMSHGSDGFLYDHNKQSIPIQDVLNEMCTDEQDSIPKVLVLQCCLCTSSKSQDGVSTDSKVPTDPAPSSYNLLSGRFDIPKRDMCILSSTLNNNPSIRGYCFSQLKKLLLSERNVDLVTIFERLNKSMDKQVPMLYTSFTRKLVLHDPMT